MRRRRFLAAAGAAAGGLVLAGAGGLEAALAAPSATPYIVLFDGRAPDARRFAEALRRGGAAAFDIRGDLARLWYGPLQQAFAGGRRPRIAGLASWADFVVAKGLAAESRLTLARHAVHDLAAADWQRTLAALAGNAVQARGDGRSSGTLVSWLIT